MSNHSLQGGTIRGSLNLPAQSLWYSLDTLYDLCRASGVSLVIFYCGAFRRTSSTLRFSRMRPPGWTTVKCGF